MDFKSTAFWEWLSNKVAERIYPVLYGLSVGFLIAMVEKFGPTLLRIL